MWHNTYKDYKKDGFFIKEGVETGKGIIGCEMHEIFGWQKKQHIPVQKKPGFLSSLWERFFKR